MEIETMADDSLPEKLHPETILRFEDLMTLRVVRSRATLAYWIQQGNFPCGRWIGENTRAWTWGEVQQWIASRPTNSRAMPKPLHKATGRKPKRKEQQTTKQAERRTTKQSGAERSAAGRV
jgi:predicted DNA-binding transcriptional regulator AlpA